MRTTVDRDDALLERGLRALIDLEARRVAALQGGTMPEIEAPPRRGGAPDLDPGLPVTRNPRR